MASIGSDYNILQPNRLLGKKIEKDYEANVFWSSMPNK